MSCAGCLPKTASASNTARRHANGSLPPVRKEEAEKLHQEFEDFKNDFAQKHNEQEDEDFTEELLILKRVEENQLACYLDDIEYMNHAIEKMIQKLKEITENESWKVTDCTE